MSIQEIEIRNFRNLTEVALTLDPTLNVLYGPNGSGKTSFLEAIFFLSSGRSFRTRSIEHLTQDQLDGFSIFCRLQNEEIVTPIGAQRLRDGEGRIRVNEKEVASHVEAAKALPLLLINTDEHQLIAGGPEFRRQFMNWGMFHVEPNFHPCWQRLRQAVKQRNAILKKMGGRLEDLAPWDHELILKSKLMDEMRKVHIQHLIPHFKNFTTLLLGDMGEITVSYYSGWNEKEGLEKVLARALARDRQLGYTQYGPHRMDLNIKVGSYLAKEVLSRGQQKLLVYALRLAQGVLLREQKGKSCIYLIDDFIAELDKHKRVLVLQSLKLLEAQIFVTGVDKGELLDVIGDAPAGMFHVEHGQIQKACKATDFAYLTQASTHVIQDQGKYVENNALPEKGMKTHQFQSN